MSMSERLSQQQIHGVSAQDHSNILAGNFSVAGNISIAENKYYTASNSEDPQTLEQTASACRNALFLTDPAVDRETLTTTKGARVAGTCEWITRHDTYHHWLRGDTHLLWISGGPGKGKTMMSIFLTEELERHTASIDSAWLAFFFCSSQDERRNTGVAVLRGLVCQIITKRPQLVKHASQYFETPERKEQTLSSLETLWVIFSKLIADAELGTMFCVLDGLDECHEDTLRSLVPRIVDLLSCQGSTQDLARKKIAFKLAIVSREIPGLQKCTRLRLDPDNDEKVASDIERVVTTKVNELSHIPGFDGTLRKAVETTLLKRAEGTFLWVGFAVHELSQEKTCSGILKALEGLPSGLSAIYSRMLLHIPVEWREINQAILRWVTMAARPLQLQELAAAIVVQPFSSQLTTDQTIRDAIAMCGPLLKVQKPEQEVILVHQSARDYLLRKEEDIDAVLEAYRIRPQNTHLEILQSSLNCVMQSGFQHKVVNLKSGSLSQESPLLRYAALHWPEHARSCATLDTDFLRSLKHFLETQHTVRRH
ncbi:hypothetical protein P171DRAFT_400591, partial [Karstenula rhodostoma CBS 690.94]